MTSTAVRVALRVRPLTQNEQLSNCSECISYIENEPQILIGTDKSFTYDHVFDTNTPQSQVYHEAAAPLLEKFMEGFNATILAYGQTGSGKTYSMGTGLDGCSDPEHEGIVPRCILDLYDGLQGRARQDPDYKYEVYVSFLELYNEELVDLLNPHLALKKKGIAPPATDPIPEITIREDIAKNIYWTGVREELCHSPEELMGYLAKGSLCRTTGSTEMNDVSSRSHAVFSVMLKQQRRENNDSENGEQGQVKSLTSKFHFVDLAGSERLKRTNAQGDRAKEGIAINSGLLALGNVISALGDETKKMTHVPYRDSKLTRLLQDSLGGNSQTLMLACVSPADTNFMETLNTLKYANRARNIKNRVTINQDFAGSSIEVNQLRALVSRLRLEIASLHAEQSGDSLARSLQRQDEVRALRNEVVRLRERMQDMSANMVQITSERDTLLMERELGELLKEEAAAEAVAEAEDGVASLPSKLETHPLIAQYQKTIQDLKNELADTRDRLAFMESVKPAMQAMAMARQVTFSNTLSCTTSNSNRKPRPEASVSSQHRRRFRRKRGGRMSASSSTTTSTSNLRSSRLKHSTIKRSQSCLPRGLAEFDEEEDDSLHLHDHDHDPVPVDEDDEGIVNDMQEEEIRQEVKESIAKARDEIRKGIQVLELVKPLDDTMTAWEEELEAFEEEERRLLCDKELQRHSPDEGISSMSSSSPIDDRLEHDLSDDIEALSVPVWEEPVKRPVRSDTPAKSVASTERNVSSALSMHSQSTVHDAKLSPQMARMLHQIQSDIKVKEELVSHLEKSEAEYTLMRRKFDDKVAHLHSQLAELQRERDEALSKTRSRYAAKPEGGVHAKEKQQLIEIRHAYEGKMKALLSEIQELKRKYTQTTATMQATRNQNESLLRSLRVNVETLKVEKKRMVKRMRQEAERVREQMSLQERRIHHLQRQQAEATMVRRRLEREHEAQKLALKKRSEEVLISTSQLKQLINVLKKAVREGGMLDERLLNNVSHIMGGSFAIVARGGLSRKQPQTRTRVNPIPVKVRASRKKDLLDRALSQFIQGKQAVVEMEQLLVRRERLAGEKLELLEERKHIYLAEKETAEATGQPMDTMALELMDERIDLMSAEISYLSARIRALQSEAAGEALDADEASPVVSLRQEKHVMFADEIIATPAQTDEWADMDAFEEQFNVPAHATPELAYDITTKIVKSLEPDESKRIAEALIDDIMNLRMSECNRQVTMQNLEKTVLDLRRTLIVMKRAAITTTVENERRIRRLEERCHHIQNPDHVPEKDGAMDAKIEDYINSGNTIFDKIYEDGLRGMIATPEPEAFAGSGDSSASSIQEDRVASSRASPVHLRRLSNTSVKPPVPLAERRTRDYANRETTPSPDRFYNMIQKRLTSQRPGGMESPIPLSVISPAEFARYATDRDSSTSSIRSSHLRRSSLQSDFSSSQSLNSWQHTTSTASQTSLSIRKRAQTLQNPPRQPSSLRELSMMATTTTYAGQHVPSAIPNARDMGDYDMPHPPLPPSSPLANYSIQRQQRRATLPPPMTAERSSTPMGNVFARLAHTPTQASSAKMAHRHSSGSVDDLRRRWDVDQLRTDTPTFS